MQPNLKLVGEPGQRNQQPNCTAGVNLLPMNAFSSAFSKTPMASTHCTLADIAKALHNVKEVRCKTDAPLITFNEYRQGAQSRGIKDIVCAWAVCGDIDHGFDQTAFDAGLNALSAIGAPVIRYQTFSHSEEAPRQRVFVFLDKPALPVEYTACWDGLNYLFGGMLDSAAKDISRLNYWPSCPPGETREVREFNVDGKVPAGNIKQALIERGSAHVSDSKQPLIFGLHIDVPAYIRDLSARDDVATSAILRLQEYEENPNNIVWVQSLLEYVSASCTYPEWRNIVWAIASLDWSCGERLCRDWSMTGAKFIEADFLSTWNSYRTGGIGIGTLIQRAKLGGWTPSAMAALTANTAPTVNTAPSMNNVPANDATPAVTAALAANGWEPVMPRFNLAESTAARLFTGAPPAQSWLCEGIFPAGKVCVLASPPGVGKSYLALDLACKAASDKTMSMAFGGTVRGGGRAVYISAEDDEGELHRRLHALVAGEPMPERLHVLSLPDVGHFGVIEPDEHGKTLRATQAWGELVSQIKALDDVRAIVLDTLQAMASGDTNAADAVQPLMNECSELAAATGATVLLLHHVAKGSTKEVRTALDAAEAIRGSGAIVGSARSAYVLWPPGDGGVKICAALDEPYTEGAVAIGLVAKTNGAARRERTFFLRDGAGLLRDVTARYQLTAAANADALQDELVRQIEKAWHDKAPFAAGAGTNGLHARRGELPPGFHDQSRPWFDVAVGSLLNTGRISRVQVKGGRRLAPIGTQDIAE